MSHDNYHVLANLFEGYMSSHPASGNPESLYKPMRYINELGGKRIRPILLLMAYQLWHEDVEEALPAALAIEYFHNFSLIHDDIMDEAGIRRGKDTVHITYGMNAAILSGDAMLIRCFDLLLQAGQKKNSGAGLCELMAATAMRICEGQQMDMDFENVDAPSEEDYLEMIRKKTACLLGASLQIGALHAGASEKDRMALYAFGEKMGMAFQIKDDCLDTFGEEIRTGKEPGSDILNHKKNYLYVHAYHSLKAADKKSFSQQYHNDSGEDRRHRIMELYRE